MWKPDILWMHVVSDIVIALAYYSIPIALFYFVRKRHDLKYKSLFILFAAFILLCGTTHIMGVWSVWHAPFDRSFVRTVGKVALLCPAGKAATATCPALNTHCSSLNVR